MRFVRVKKKPQPHRNNSQDKEVTKNDEEVGYGEAFLCSRLISLLDVNGLLN
jgi:hypothetical protein